MPVTRHQRYFLYLLAAFVLLLKSFAVWHDASHPFHVTTEQCHRLEAITHIHGLDYVPQLAVQFSVHSYIATVTKPVVSIPQRQPEYNSIRAPPVFS